MVALLPLVVSETLFPTFKLISTKTGPDKLASDIAGSAFTGVDGAFHFITSAADYEQSDSGGSFVNTFTADNFGVMMNNGPTVKTYANTYWNRPGTYCYQVDKRPNKPMPSLYQDDHCDVVGVWIDPATKGWYGIVNDEYQFEPWKFINLTQNQRIKTGRHNNRVLLAHSADQGATWDLVDQIITDKYQPQQTITPELFPNQTYSWGLSGTRFYVDYTTGYAYALYNHQIRNKVGDATLIKWFGLARSPLVSGLAPNTWRKYAHGRWDQPGIGGTEDPIEEPLGFTVNYDPKTDYIAFEGTGADGKPVAYQSIPVPTNGTFTFADGAGVKYTVDMGASTIKRIDNGQVVGSVTYHDPALDRTIWVGPGVNGILVNTTTNLGYVSSMNPKTAKNVLRERTTQRLYVVPAAMTQVAFSYNVPAGKYRVAGYDSYAHELSDLGNPNTWVTVGKAPDIILKHAAYMTSLDTGSLSNQRVTSRTYAMISDLYVTMDTINVTPHTAGQTSYSKDVVLKDSSGAPLANSSPYHVKIGGTPFCVGGSSDQWSLEPVFDTYLTNYKTGFFRLKNSAGEFLRVQPGSSPADERKWGAGITTTKAVLPEYDPAGNGGMGAPGGSDQWYLLPIGGNTPAVLNPDSPAVVVAAAQRTSLDNAMGYKLVSRNSDLVLANVNGVWQIVPNEFAKNAAQKVEFTK